MKINIQGVVMKIVLRILLLSLCLFGGPFLLEGATMTDYCQLPSSLAAPIDPNVMFAIDESGSMGWCAYTSETGSGSCENTTTPYVSTTTYEGYFDPTKYYTLDSSSVYVETTVTGTPCTTTCTNWTCRNFPFGDCDTTKGTHDCSSKKYACCTAYTSSGDCTVSSGNYLNYTLMRRIDTISSDREAHSLNNSISIAPLNYRIPIELR
jgi:type IV pilus assembly protein PilY1